MPAASFTQFQADFFRLYDEGNFEDALILIRLMGGLFPERANATYNWRICLASRLGQEEEALRLFQEALDLGLWWTVPSLRKDPDLASLQGQPIFEAGLEVCQARHSRALQSARAEALFYAPGEAASKPYPTLLAFHGSNGNARETLEAWKSLAEQGWLVAAVQSSQVLGFGAYGWSDLNTAEQDVRSQFVELEKHFPVDAGRLALGGFSQGGGLAIHLALKGALPARGFIAVAPYLQNIKVLSQVRSNGHPPKPRGYLVTGQKDPSLEMFAQIRALLEARNLPHQIALVPDLGHEYPPDFPEILQRAVDFIHLSQSGV